MLDIEKVNGILIAPDGSFKSFGTYKDAPVSELTDDNFHDSSFKKDVSNDEWFINLQKDIGIDYTDDTIHRQGGDWASNGVVLMVHGGTGAGEFYGVLAPSQLSGDQRSLFEKNYVNLQNQIEKNEVYFEATLFDEDGNYANDGLIFGLENFYNREHLAMGNEMVGRIR